MFIDSLRDIGTMETTDCAFEHCVCWNTCKKEIKSKDIDISEWVCQHPRPGANRSEFENYLTTAEEERIIHNRIFRQWR